MYKKFFKIELILGFCIVLACVLFPDPGVCLELDSILPMGSDERTSVGRLSPEQRIELWTAVQRDLGRDGSTLRECVVSDGPAGRGSRKENGAFWDKHGPKFVSDISGDVGARWGRGERDPEGIRQWFGPCDYGVTDWIKRHVRECLSDRGWLVRGGK
jgi:hypothetical protein